MAVLLLCEVPAALGSGLCVTARTQHWDPSCARVAATSHNRLHFVKSVGPKPLLEKKQHGKTRRRWEKPSTSWSTKTDCQEGVLRCVSMGESTLILQHQHQLWQELLPTPESDSSAAKLQKGDLRMGGEKKH